MEQNKDFINNEHIYIKLQRHLDSQAVGYPVTKSGAEIRILKHIFTPIEAEIATSLTYKYEPLEVIFERAGHLVESQEKLSQMLGHLADKGGIESKIKDGKFFYCNAPLVVGMFEHQLGKLTREFIKDFNEYVSDKKFGLAFISTKLPQMRTIPIAESIRLQHNVSTFDEIAVLLHKAKAPFAVFECICRQKKSLEGKPCRVTDRKETCIAFGSTAQAVLRRGSGREITLDETVSIIEQNQKQGLVLQPSNTQELEFVCSCCGCCCGILSMHKNLTKPVNFWASNYYAVVDTDACDGCGICEKRCQAGAASISENKKQTLIDLNRCIGCGVCIPTCPQNAISLHKKDNEVLPPQTKEDLYDIIMAHRKGRLDKRKVTGKLCIDAFQTGQTHLLKKL